MSDDFEDRIEASAEEIELIKDLVLLLISHGMPQVSMGAMLRILGHDPDACLAYDDEVYDLTPADPSNSQGKTLH
jgi:hypothetical protein